MNTDRIIRELNELEGADKESAHQDGDELLLEALEEAGLRGVVDAWRQAKDRIGFHYA